jgi:hypothetical protein
LRGRVDAFAQAALLLIDWCRRIMVDRVWWSGFGVRARGKRMELEPVVDAPTNEYRPFAARTV